MKQLKKPKFNIFSKIFLITTVTLMGITFISLSLIYLFLPIFYQNHIINAYTELVESRIPELE